MAMNVGIIKEGWVMREEIVEGSMATWRKRYFVLSLQKLSCFKHDKVLQQPQGYSFSRSLARKILRSIISRSTSIIQSRSLLE